MNSALGFAVAFVAGWAVMALEILAGRLLAPVFGYSVYQWGALIGTVMAALAAGYALGGRVGDGPKARAWLLWHIGASCGYTFLLPWLAGTLVPPTRELGPILGAVVASLLLVGPQSFLLATVSPIVTRMTASGGIATSAGRVYAISTLGSIGGVFFTSFFSIPELGTRASGFVCALLLGLAAVALIVARRKAAGGAAAAVLAAVTAVCIGSNPRLGAGVLFEGESIHSWLRVADQDGRRFLYMNYEKGVQTHIVPGQLLTNTYRDYFLLGPYLNGGRKILVLGVAGGASVRQAIQVFPDSEVTGVDLDPLALEVGRKYFELEGLPRMRLVTADARWFLSRTTEIYDVIGVDLYVTGHIPFFAATREFFELVRARLSPEGIVIMNIYAPGRERDALVGPLLKTLQSVIPGLAVIDGVNVMVFGSRDPSFDTASVRKRLEAPIGPGPLAQVARVALMNLMPAPGGGDWPIFTDDRSDVEFRTFRNLNSAR